MGSHAKNALIVAAILTAFMALVPPALVGGRQEAVGSFISDYQTLITGIMAVAAAYATVRQMRITEKLADDRHEETKRLAMRADRLRVERAVNPQLDNFRAVRRRLAALDVSMAKHKDRPGDPHYHFVTEATGDYLQAVQFLNKVLARPQFQECRPLFDGYLTEKLDILERIAQEVAEGLLTHRNMRDPMVTGAEEADYYNLFGFDEVNGDLRDKVLALPWFLDLVIEGLVKMAQLYLIYDKN